ncbi:hypothetical protein EVAR_72005_1 [Eumeta japonica]|uniref:Uncharacterized protein n=1 Tax=Eumeta variegata TaxID=151549 RepID=A0A4C1T4X7_EUMVA|nr:hypothetical protein EVAR_72005_1 [Eumeta japonica]
MACGTTEGTLAQWFIGHGTDDTWAAYEGIAPVELLGCIRESHSCFKLLVEPPRWRAAPAPLTRPAAEPPLILLLLPKPTVPDRPVIMPPELGQRSGSPKAPPPPPPVALMLPARAVLKPPAFRPVPLYHCQHLRYFVCCDGMENLGR